MIVTSSNPSTSSPPPPPNVTAPGEGHRGMGLVPTGGRGCRFALGKHQVREGNWPRTWANSRVPKEGNWDKVGRSRDHFETLRLQRRGRLNPGPCQPSQMVPCRSPHRARFPCLSSMQAPGCITGCIRRFGCLKPPTMLLLLRPQCRSLKNSLALPNLFLIELPACLVL